MGDKLSKEVVDFQPLTSITNGSQWGLAMAPCTYNDGKRKGFGFGFVKMWNGSPVVMYQFNNCWSLGQDGWFCNALVVYSADRESSYADLEMRNYCGSVWYRRAGNAALFHFEAEYVKAIDFRVYDLYSDVKYHIHMMSEVCQNFLNGKTAYKTATSFTDQVELSRGLFIRRLTSSASGFHLVEEREDTVQERTIGWCRWDSSNAVSLWAGPDGKRVILSIYLNRKKELILESHDVWLSTAYVLNPRSFLSLNLDPFLPHLQPLKELQDDVQKTLSVPYAQEMDLIFFESTTTTHK